MLNTQTSKIKLAQENPLIKLTKYEIDDIENIPLASWNEHNDILGNFSEDQNTYKFEGDGIFYFGSQHTTNPDSPILKEIDNDFDEFTDKNKDVVVENLCYKL